MLVARRTIEPTGCVCQTCLYPVEAEPGTVAICDQCSPQNEETILKCKACPRAVSSRIQVVPWKGSRTGGKILVLGQGPGISEDKAGEPFIGPSGQRLREGLSLANMDIDDVVLGNRILCYLGRDDKGDRAPTPTELKNCKPHFEFFLKLYNIKWIITMSASAIHYFLPEEKISDSHGKVFTVGDYKIIPMYHPAATLHKPINPDIVKSYWDDWKNLSEMLGGGKNIKKPDFAYEIIDSEPALAKLAKYLSTCKQISFDTEFTELNPYISDLCGISLSDGTQAWYVAVMSKDGKHIPFETVKRYLEPILSNPNILKATWNGKVDALLLEYLGFARVQNISDCMIMEYLISGLGSLGLKANTVKYFDTQMIELNDVTHGQRFNTVPLATAARYSSADAYYTYKHHERLFPQIESDQRLNWLYTNVYKPAIRVLIEMESNGATINLEKLAELRVLYEKTSSEVESRLSINVSSPGANGQVAKLLFDTLKLPDFSGVRSTAKEYLEKLSDINPIADDISKARFAKYLKSTWCDSLSAATVKGRAHTHFNLTTVVSGRLSTSDPVSFQNVPRKRVEGGWIRECYIAPEGYGVLKADLSSQEPRWSAHLSQDVELLRIFNSGSDVHSETGLAVFPIHDCTVKEFKAKYKDLRDIAKVLILAAIYGAEDDTLAVHAMQANVLLAKYGYPNVDTKGLRNKLMDKYPGVAVYVEKIHRFVHDNGYIDSYFGFRRVFPRPINNRALGEAANHVLQSSASQQVLLGMIKLQAAIDKNHMKSQIILQVHDELVLRFFEPELVDIAALLKDSLETAVKLSVPVVAELAAGMSWGKVYANCPTCKADFTHFDYSIGFCKECGTTL